MLVEVRLRLAAENLHLVLVQTLVRAELQLRGAVLEVHVADRVPYVLAPIAGFGALERGAATLREARFGAVARTLRGGEKFGRAERHGTLAPAAFDLYVCANASNKQNNKLYGIHPPTRAWLLINDVHAVHSIE